MLERKLLHHFCVTSEPGHPGAALLALSAAAAGITTQVLVCPTPFKFSYKLVLLEKALSSLPDSDPVLFTDAHDVVLCNENAKERLIQQCLDFPLHVLFNGEKSPHPAAQRNTRAHERANALFPFFNSGAGVGTAGAWRAVLRFALPCHTDADDQELLWRAREDGAPIAIDFSGRLLCAAHGVPRRAVVIDGAKIRVWGEHPAVLHLNNGWTRWKWARRVGRAVGEDAGARLGTEVARRACPLPTWLERVVAFT